MCSVKSYCFLLSIFVLGISSGFGFPVLAQKLFHSIGCGSGCNIEYYLDKDPYRGSDSLTKVLVREVVTSGGGGGSPLKRISRKVWLIADCTRNTVNISSQSSNGRGSHSDVLGWQRINYEPGTNFDSGVKELYLKLCK